MCPVKPQHEVRKGRALGEEINECSHTSFELFWEWGGLREFMLEAHRLVVEGGGAVGIAAVMSRRFVPGNRSVVVLSGSNVGLATLLEIAGRTRDDDMRGVVR